MIKRTANGSRWEGIGTREHVMMSESVIDRTYGWSNPQGMKRSDFHPTMLVYGREGTDYVRPAARIQPEADQEQPEDPAAPEQSTLADASDLQRIGEAATKVTSIWSCLRK
jgi:hypothetical protein